MKRSKKKFLALVAFGMAALMLVIGVLSAMGPTDKELRGKVVKLVSPQGSCSGFQVKGTSGQSYIMTAGHCNVLIRDGMVTVIKESGERLQRRVIQEDEASDLLLIEGLPGVEGLDVALSARPASKGISFTHPRGMDTVKTEGVLIQEEEVMIPIGNYVEGKSCGSKKYKSKEVDFGFFQIQVCALVVVEMITNIQTAPGSSGGLVVNESGQVVGVVSAGDGTYTLLVTLSDIRNLLANY